MGQLDFELGQFSLEASWVFNELQFPNDYSNK